MSFTAKFLVLLLLVGCASDPWSEYDTSLYRLFKDATPQSRAAHLELLGRILAKVGKDGSPPPPGINAEYGWFLCQAGRTGEGMRYFEKEVSFYPESSKFVKALGLLAKGQKPLSGKGEK